MKQDLKADFPQWKIKMLIQMVMITNLTIKFNTDNVSLKK